jgi:methyltransferase-like protein/protein-L-isoaspartate O-methyltransferase
LATIEGSTTNVYDQVPYPSMSFGYTHPDHLATIGWLLGMEPADVERCRVLELGCASGGNLIPMAYMLPGSEFLGIDFSQREIAEGQAELEELALPNVVLRHADILDVTPEWGRFDYIIAHGIYSWVPPEVQRKILAICRANLAPQGIAYVSYNTLPGWHMLRVVRDLMLYASEGIDDPYEKATTAAAVVDFYANATSEEGAYGSFLRSYNKTVQIKLDSTNGSQYASVLHDELEDINDPLYFRDFVARAAGQGLQYMCDTDFSISTGTRISDDVSHKLEEITHGDRVALEQYADFLACRTFRRSLLCHREVQINERLKPAAIRRLRAASDARPVSEQPDLYGRSTEKFETPDDKAAVSTNHPVSKLAMTLLAAAYPSSIAFADLLAEARARLAAHLAEQGGVEGPEAEDVDSEALAANLLSSFGYSRNLMELHVWAPGLVRSLGERPEASQVARCEARRGTWVTNVRHERVRLEPLDAYLLTLLDGRHDRPALLEAVIAGPVAEGRLVARRDGQPVDDPADARQVLARSIDDRLTWLARACLLVG